MIVHVPRVNAVQYVASVGSWAEANFAGADLGDARRASRLVRCAAGIAAQPEKSFPQVFDWNELRGFYRVCDNVENPDAVQSPHRELTRQAMSRHEVVLVFHDTSTLDFSSHAALVGDGPIGDGNGHGFLQHNSLAFAADGKTLLGLIHQQVFVREAAPPNESAAARKRRQARESRVWVENVQAVGEPPEGTAIVDVGDRASDDYEAMKASRDAGHHFLFRVCQDRKVFLSAAFDREALLMRHARGLPAVGHDVVKIPGRGGRPPRTAKVALAAAPVWVPAPWGTPQRESQPILQAWVIRVWEVDAPPGVEEPLEWVLLCSIETVTPEQIEQKRDWYCGRWCVEVFHDVEKNGCHEQERMFQTAARMRACLAILSVIAVRVYQLRLALREAPDAPASEVATAEEIALIASLPKAKKRESLTVKDFVFAVAKLGGFLGRKGDGEPGVRALWRGYQRLQDMLAGFRLHKRRSD